MIRKSFSIAGMLAGVGYAVIGMIGAYRHAPPGISSSLSQVALEFLVFSCFTAPLGGAIGLGLGLLAEGLTASFQKQK